MLENIIWYAPQLVASMVGLLLIIAALEIVRILRQRRIMKTINVQYVPQIVYPEVTVKTGDTAVIMRSQDKALNRLVLSLVRKASE